MRKFVTEMQKKRLREQIEEAILGESVQISGWIIHRRCSKKMFFLTLQDGSLEQPVQLVINRDEDFDIQLPLLQTGSAITAWGQFVEAHNVGNPREFKVDKLQLLGSSYQNPIQTKKHGLDYLRLHPHLRLRTAFFRSIMWIRHILADSIHTFFKKEGFCFLHSPIITTMDTEGAGDLFVLEDKKYFNKEAYLTVSGQLVAEVAIMGLGKVYTFGPTFRAENSNTTRHLSEFWMVEPEMAFHDLNDNIQLAIRMIHYISRAVIEKGKGWLSIIEKYQKKNQLNDDSILTQLEKLSVSEFITITYSKAIEILSDALKKKQAVFSFHVKWGLPLQTEHEQYLLKIYKQPLIVKDYPKQCKAFYMRQNQDGKTVAAMDILLPGIGEIIGGSQREERLSLLMDRIQEVGISEKEISWYISTRRFGTIPHSGFGIGFDRFLAYILHLNIKDTIPFPRSPGYITA